MSITIQQTPQAFSPGFNDLIYVVSSNNTAQPNFQFVCDIYLTDDNGAVTPNGQNYIRTKTPVDPVYSSGVFNISKHVQPYLKWDIGDDTYGFQKNPNSIIRVQCKFGEEYGPSSGITVYPDLATDSTNRAFWNGVLEHPDFVNYNADEWREISVSTTRKTLTYRPTSGTIRSDEDEWLYVLQGDVNEIRYMMVEVWKQNGTFQRLFQIDNPFSASLSTTGRRHLRVPVGLGQLDQIPAASLLSGSQPISLNAGRYRVLFYNSTSGQVRAEQWYVVDDAYCTPHTRYRLHFLNKAGGFDSFTFTRANQQSVDIQRDKFKRNNITRIGGGRYGYNMDAHSNIDYRTKVKEKVKINSDWITEDQCTWLEQLVTSPVVYHDDATYGRLAINILETNYVRRKHLTDKVINLEITFEYSYDKYRQSQ